MKWVYPIKTAEIEKKTIDEICDLGLFLIRSGILYRDDQEINRGMEYLINAYRNGDHEAAAWIGVFLYRGVLGLPSGNAENAATEILMSAACRGSLTARVFLNKLCLNRYEGIMSKQPEDRKPAGGPLVDFDGKRIVINKTGRRYPVDAVLEYRDGTNILTFSLNIFFLYDELPDPSEFKKAVIRGIKEWEGIYKVFGGQTLQVAINVTAENRLSDSVFVASATKIVASTFKRIPEPLKSEAGKKRMNDLINNKRSMAAMGFFGKWSTRSRRFIFLASQDDSFSDYYEIQSAVKHEFGHVLGLGDLYASISEHLPGVERGTYSELDGYYINNMFYNLVMCDHHGPVSNNDIEMAVLAFSNDEVQLYQKEPGFKGKNVSEALGKGN